MLKKTDEMSFSNKHVIWGINALGSYFQVVHET